MNDVGTRGGIKKTELSRAIDAYRAAPVAWDGGGCRLTRGEEIMLDRLRDSKEATEAFAGWQLPDGKRPFFIADCVAAHRLLNGGHSKKVAARRTLPDPDKVRKDLASVASYFSGSGYRLRLDPKAIRDGTKLCVGPDPDVVSEALALLASLIDSAEDINKRAKPTISRKGDKPSARASALGHLKESIYRLTGHPNLTAVEDIGKAVLDLHGSEIDVAVAVKNAHTPSEWFAEWGK
jgi:hypothetical protein